MSASNSRIQISRSEIEQCQAIVNNFRVNQLHILLSSYQFPKLGKKQELVNKAISILNNPKHQLSAVQKIREIDVSSNMRNPIQPLPQNSMFNSNYNNYCPNTINQNRQQFISHNHAGSYIPTNVINRPNGFPAYGSYGSHNLPHIPGYCPVMPNNVGNYIPPQQQFQQSSAVLYSANCHVRDLKISDLPFYNQLKVIIPLTELPSYHHQVRPGEAKHHHQFSIPQEDISNLFYRNDEKPLPRIEIQMRIFQLDTSSEQPDAFPPGCIVKLDDYSVNLPNIIPTNKPNAEPKRLSRPVNLTPYCQPPRGAQRPHKITLEWNGDKRAWAFCILIVRRVNSTILLDNILKNPNSFRPYEKTKEIVINRLAGSDDDDGIHMDTLKVSLLDPLMRTRIKIPSRAADCTHLQCFDLLNYLMMNEKRPVWKCPVCDNNALFSNLIVDRYYEQMLKNVNNKDDVELLKDGSWQIKKEEALNIPSDDDDIVIVPINKHKKIETSEEATSSHQNSIGLKSNNQKNSTLAENVCVSEKTTDDNIICLSSDSEDESQLQSKTSTANINSRKISVPTSSDESNQPRNTESTKIDTEKQKPVENGIETSQSTQNLSSGIRQTSNFPLLQTNGYHPPVFRSIIDQIAQQQVALNLMEFLQNISAKNGLN